MQKIKYYNKVAKGNMQHEICIQSWKIRERFKRFEDARNLSEKLQANLTSLKSLFKTVEMDGGKFNSLPYTHDDIRRVETARIKIHPLIEDALIGDGENLDATLSVKNPTVAEMIKGYATWLDTEKAIKKRRLLLPLKRDKQGKLPLRFQFWIDNPLGKVRASKVKVSMLQNELNELGPMSKSTYNHYVHSLSAAWTRAMDHEDCQIASHLPQKLDTLDLSDTVNTPSYSVDQMKEIVELMYAEDRRISDNNAMEVRWGPEGFCHLGPLVEVAAYTGIRESFLQSLHLDEILYKGGKMYITKAMKGGKVVPVPVIPHAVEVIKRQMELHEVRTSGYLFPFKGGYSTGWYNRFKDVLVQNDLKISPKPFHSFRSFAATQYAKAGFSIKQIGLALGVTDRVAEGYIDRTFIQDNFHNKADQIGNLTPKQRRHLTIVKGEEDAS